jgi:hypothetical protein
MHRTQGDSFGIVSGKRVYREESPGNWDATQAQAADGNAWQEELANIIEDGGISLNLPTETVAQMNQASGVIQGYVSAEAFTRNANDRVTNGDMVRDQINTVNDTDFDEPLFATVMRMMGRTLQGFWCAQASSPSDRVAINRGFAVAVGDAQIINLKAAIRKDLETAWAVGDNQGGRATGAALADDTWYHLFAIKKSDGTVDAGYDTVLNAANLLSDSGYTYYRRVASVYYIDSTSKVRPFVHHIGSDYFLHKPNVDDGNFAIALAPTVSPVTLAKGVPPGIEIAVDCFCSASYTGSAWNLWLWDGVNGSTSQQGFARFLEGVSAATQRNDFRFIVDTSQRIFALESLATGTPNLNVSTRGYHDSRWIA